MGSHIAIVTKCTRCPATSSQEVTLEELRKLDTLATEDKTGITIRLDGKLTVEFGALCEPCHDIVERYVALIGRVSEKKSSLRKAKDLEVDEEEA